MKVEFEEFGNRGIQKTDILQSTQRKNGFKIELSNEKRKLISKLSLPRNHLDLAKILY